MTGPKRGRVVHRVKDLLAREVGGHDTPRPLDELHASDLTRDDLPFCPRERVLMRLLDRQREPERVQQAMRVTWDEGADKQDRLNNHYLRSYMVGDWRCVRCDEEAHWCHAPDVTGKGGRCHDNRAHRWKYVETEFHHPSGLSGAIDGFVDFGPGTKLRAIECKIIKGESSNNSSAPDFKTLAGVLGEHRARSQLYLRLIAESNDERIEDIDLTCVSVLYWMRGHGLKDERNMISPFKEYVVERNDEAVEVYLRMARATRGPMPHGICTSVLSKRAASCLVAKECFSGKYPPKHNWSEGA